VADAALAHRRHEPIEVAATADRGAGVPAWLAGCRACLALRADLLALAAALPTAAIPRRRRDLRLSTSDAVRLRSRARWWMLDGIGTPRDRVTRPLALGLSTMGLVGVLLTTMPLAAPGSAGASDTALALAGASSAAPAVAFGPSTGAAATPDIEVRSATTPTDGASPWTPQALLAAMVGSGGLALFALRHVARRRGSIR
jgi:hypothetical protein